MASIVLLQNDPRVGEGLRKAIAAEAGLRVSGVTADLAQTRLHLERGGVDLLVADLRIGNRRLIELLRERRDHGPAGRPLVLVIAMSADDPHLMQALRHGADGYFIHGNSLQALARVIRQVLAGESPMSPPIARRLQAHFRQPGVPGGSRHDPALPAQGLSDAESRMLERVGQGYLPHEIALEMQTSEHSLGLRSRSLYRKLQLDMRAGASIRQAA